MRATPHTILNESLLYIDFYLRIYVKNVGGNMKNSTNNDELLQRDIDATYLVLYQVWKELTDFRKLDSYQYRIMNSLSAISELVDVLNNRLRRVHTSNHNINEYKSILQHFLLYIYH